MLLERLGRLDSKGTSVTGWIHVSLLSFGSGLREITFWNEFLSQPKQITWMFKQTVLTGPTISVTSTQKPGYYHYTKTGLLFVYASQLLILSCPKLFPGSCIHQLTFQKVSAQSYIRLLRCKYQSDAFAR